MENFREVLNVTKLLLRLFVREHRNTEDPAVRGAIGSLAGGTGIACNCLLALIKLIAGLGVGSVAITADGLNNLSDAAASIVTLLGFRLARRPADQDHPYGHARYEYLSGLIISALILLIGADLVKTSVGKIINPSPIVFSAVTFAVLACSIAVKLWMACFFRKLGEMIHSTALKATAADSRNDVIATAAVLLGCIAGAVWDVNADGFLGLGVAVFILVSGVGMAKATVSPLLGQQADPALVENISRLVLSHERVLDIHDLLIHDYGPGQCFASVHAELSAAEDPLECHEIIDALECAALNELNVHLVIHYDPVVTESREWDEMRRFVTRAVQEIDPRLSIHDLRITGTKLTFDLAVPYEMRGQTQELEERIRSALQAAGKEYDTVIRIDER